MLGFFFTSTHVSKANWIVVRLRCATNSGDDIPGALGWQWHFSGQFEQFFVCSNWCLQKVLMFEDKNMGIPCLGRCLRRVSGSRRVSGCLGMVSRGGKKHYLLIHKKRTSAQRTIKKRTIPPGEKTIIVFHLKNGLPLREQKSGLPLREHQKKRTTAQKTKNMSPKKADYR